MVRITYVEPDGLRKVLDVRAGSSLMQGATDHAVQGIVGECGGQLMCGTCHVYVEWDRLASLLVPSDFEDEMLDATASPRHENSRLSCQLVAGDELEGLVVHLPPTQI
jgi:2Fe-2S ferredoxin